MIVTCESCSSRYKVDDAKVSGRGARITCPKCKHQFVVYASKPEASKPGVKPQGPAGEWENDEPTRVGAPKTKPDDRGITGVFAIGGRPDGFNTEDSAEQTAAEPRSRLPVAPSAPAGRQTAEPDPRGRPPEPTPSQSPARAAEAGRRAPEPTPSLGPMRAPTGRAAEAARMEASPAAAAAFAPDPRALESDLPDAPSGVYVKPTMNAPEDPYEVAVPPPSPRINTADAASRAPTLDFRKVGVMHWKVKVKIGLTYDFSDLKTLRKYISDGRVTPSDLISFNGRDWKAIGDIPDLDVFFVETYDRLAAEQASRPADESIPPTPTRSIPPTPISALGPDSDPFSTLKGPRKTPKDPNRRTTSTSGRTTGTVPVKPPAPSSSRMWLAGLLLLILIGGGFWWSQQTPPPPATVVAPPPAEPVEPAAEPETTPTPAGTLPGGLTVVPEEPAPRPEDLLTPVGPKGTNPGGTSNNTRAPSSSQVGEKASSASDHAQVGDDAAKAGNWSAAAKAYAKAAAADTKNASYQAKYGNALYRSGNLDGAVAALKTAAKMGARDANKTLGYVLKDLGDTAGAIAAWTTYLKSNPKDAEIDKQLKALNGG